MWTDILMRMKKSSGKTTEIIAAESGVPLGTLNKIFAGQTKDPKIETIKAVVYCLGYKLDDLYEVSVEPTLEEQMRRFLDTLSPEQVALMTVIAEKLLEVIKAKTKELRE